MCTITHLGAISADIAVAILAYTSGNTRPMHGRYSVNSRSYIGSMAVNMLADTPLQLDRYVVRVADRGISAVYWRYIGDISVVYRWYIGSMSARNLPVDT